MRALLLVALCAVAASASWTTDAPISWDTIRAKFMRGVDDSTPHTFFKGLMQNIVAALPPSVRNKPVERDGDSIGPWFGWIPLYMGSAIPAAADDALGDGGVTATWSAPCFANNTMSAVMNADGQGATLTITATNPTSLLCSDLYLIGTVDGVTFKATDALQPGSSQVSYTFRQGISASELLDIKTNGFRVFRFLNDLLTTVEDLYATIMLFLPAMSTTGPVPESCAKDNLVFMQQYVNISMEARAANGSNVLVSVDEGLIQSGDMFGIIRLDGLDPMLAWAMGGSHTGHVTVAMRSTDGALHVCESTTKDNYWPTNGIQCTPFQTWLAQAANADYNVVWLPLSQESRAVFNNTKAWEFINGDLGLNYGFGNILWGWIDLESDNYPYPLTWQLHQLLPAWVGHLSQVVSDLLWNQAFNFRVGTTGLNTADVYAKMMQLGLTWPQMASIPEQDDWMYSQTDNNGATVKGHSSVCDVFVCRVWKAAGLFGDTDFQCTEATNWDVYTLNIFEDQVQLPPQCTQTDPELPFCQLTGRYRLRLPYWNTRTLGTNAFNNCPRGNPPDWNKPIGC